MVVVVTVNNTHQLLSVKSKEDFIEVLRRMTYTFCFLVAFARRGFDLTDTRERETGREGWDLDYLSMLGSACCSCGAAGCPWFQADHIARSAGGGRGGGGFFGDDSSNSKFRGEKGKKNQKKKQ